MAQLRGWKVDGDPTDASSSGRARLRYKPLLGEFHYLVDSVSSVLPVGIQLILDFANYYEGEISYEPFDISRMVLRGGKQPLPPFSGEAGYEGGIKLDVLVQSRGKAEFLTTQATPIRAIDQLYDNYVVTSEAAQGKLPIYELQAPRSFVIPQGVTLFAPVFAVIGWTARDGLKGFGPRLTPPPTSISAVADTAVSPRLETDHVFETAVRSGEVMPPPARPKPAPRRSADLVPAGGLDDEIPF